MNLENEIMYMKSMVPYCDYNEKVYPSPVEGAVLLEESIKENGRWMIHMHILSLIHI